MTARPGVPQYFNQPYSDKDIGPNGVPLPPLGATQAGSGLLSHPATTNVSRETPDTAKDKSRATSRIRFDFADEKPVSPETTEALLRAVSKVHRVVTDRISYHEREAQKLRASLAPFAAMSGTGPATEAVPQTATTEDFIQQLVALADQIPEGQP